MANFGGSPAGERFRDAAQSLKLYRRAELRDEDGTALIDDLYVDPLPGEHVLQTLLRSNTTFLIGRKGTGKSTIFQKAQHDLRKKKGVTTAYIDIKSVYESSVVDPNMFKNASEMSDVMPRAMVERLLLNRNFIFEVITSIKEEVEKRINSTFWGRTKEKIVGNSSDLFSNLDKLIESSRNDRFESVIGTYVESKKSNTNHEGSTEFGIGSKISALDPNVTSGITENSAFSQSEEAEQVDVLMRIFDLKNVIHNLKIILNECGIDQLYVFLDDFSEMPEPAMRTVVDVLLAPLNNWSDELIKFKVAAYPGRIYYGSIDPTKIDEINLDLYNLYGGADVDVMEEKAIDFTKRLVTRRLEHYNAGELSNVFDTSSGGDVWRQIFYATMANPRNLGYLLYFAYEGSLLYGKPIGSSSIKIAAQRFYEEKVETTFNMNRFLRQSFDERSSIFSLKDLLYEIVKKARSLKSSDSTVLKVIQGKAPTSHFHIGPNHESLIQSLELNFFLTKYNVMKNKDGNKVSVYALNYGLCMQNKLEFGRPSGAREQRYRQYFVERIFDYSAIFQNYIKNNQEISCDSCGERQEADALPVLKAYKMLCPECQIGTCRVVNLSRKYEDELREVEQTSLLPPIELGILQALTSNLEAKSPKEVAGELDCPYQLVTHRAKNLDDRSLVSREKNEANRSVYRATKLAREVYFSAENGLGFDNGDS